MNSRETDKIHNKCRVVGGKSVALKIRKTNKIVTKEVTIFNPSMFER